MDDKPYFWRIWSYSARLWYTVLQRTVTISFILILQTIIVAQMLLTGVEENLPQTSSVTWCINGRDICLRNPIN